VGSATVGEPLAFALTNLLPGIVYPYRLVASAQAGTSYGPDETFTTTGLPTLITQPLAPPLLAVPAISFPSKSAPLTPTPPPETRAQKYAKAVALCAKKPKKKRAGCLRTARKQFGTAVKKGKKK
jgi:hypothetical protein